MVLFISQVLYLTKVISIIQQHGLMGPSCFLQGIKSLTFGKIWNLTFWSQELKGTWLTFPCSTKEKNLSTSLLKAVIFISLCWSEDSMKRNIPTWKHIQYVHWQTSSLEFQDSHFHLLFQRRRAFLLLWSYSSCGYWTCSWLGLWWSI